MDITSFQALLSPPGQEALQAAVALTPHESDYLLDFAALRRSFDTELARIALETAILRQQAQQKFPLAEKMYFTREALEQASAYQVSAYRAERYRPFSQLADLGCSIGGDTLSLAFIAPTLGIDLDQLRLAMAQANLDAAGLGERATFTRADLSQSLPLSGKPATALFFDPARRAAGRRIYSVNAYHPPLYTVRSWLESFPALGVKLSPGVRLEELEGYPAEVEFISLGGELKEGVLWFGELKSAWRRATVLPAGLSLSIQGIRELAEIPVREPSAYLYEPDPAVLRAGLVTNVGQLIGAAQLDRDIAYLTADSKRTTPFARVWEVDDWMPFGLKRLRTYLRERGIGRVVVKKRGSPLEPESLIKELRLKGDKEKVIVLTQQEGKPIVIVCSPPERMARNDIYL